MNRLRERITRIRMTDQGCMLRAYSRDDRRRDHAAAARSTPSSRRSPTPSPQQPDRDRGRARGARTPGESKYSLYKLIRLNFDLVTGFSVVPLQMFSHARHRRLAAGARCSSASSPTAASVLGPEAEGLFTLFAIDFLLIGVALFGIGLLGEYVGRIYQQVRERPRYLIQAILEQREEPEARSESRAGLARAAHSAVTPRFALMRAVVFAYHNVGVPLPVGAARARRRGRAGGHPRRQSRREHLVRQRRARWRGCTTCPWSSPTDPNAPDFVARVRGDRARLPVLVLLPADALRRRCSSIPRAAPSTCTARCCRSTAAACRSTGRSSRASARPARRCTTWSTKPDAGDIVDQQAVPILPDDTAVDVFRKVTVAAELVLDRALPDAARRHARRASPQDLARGSYFGGRRPEDGRIDWSQPARGDPQPGARRRAALPRRLHRGPGHGTCACCARALPRDDAGRARAPGAVLPTRALLRANAATAACCASSTWKWTVQCRRRAQLSQRARRTPPCAADRDLHRHEKDLHPRRQRLHRPSPVQAHHRRPPTGRSTAWTCRPSASPTCWSTRASTSSRATSPSTGVDRVPHPQVRHGPAAGGDRDAGDLRARSRCGCSSSTSRPTCRSCARCVKYGKRILFPSTSEVYGMCRDAEFDPEASELVLGPIAKQRWIYACAQAAHGPRDLGLRLGGAARLHAVPPVQLDRRRASTTSTPPRKAARA